MGLLVLLYRITQLLGEKEKALRLVPTVEYVVNSKMERKKPKKPDYWDYATLLELAIIENRFSIAERFFYKSKPFANESWMFGTTKENLNKILNFRKQRNEDTAELEKIISLFG
jgi:hypothetical protein